jgi:predicted nucleotidyltransferase
MERTIQEKLDEIERVHNVKILLAVESGSRAWGFASPDSDYDVRFIYVRPKEGYLALNEKKDVIEYILDDTLDINGWDINKTLKLLHASNPTLFEWMNSPIVYRRHPFMKKITDISDGYFLEKHGLYHYLSMAEKNYREYLKGETVRQKKYFYVLRPLLCCRYVLQNHVSPPMAFDQLLHTLMDKELVGAVERLLEEKRQSPEKREAPRIPELNSFIEKNIDSLKKEIDALPAAKKQPWEHLNALFLMSLEI